MEPTPAPKTVKAPPNLDFNRERRPPKAPPPGITPERGYYPATSGVKPEPDLDLATYDFPAKASPFVKEETELEEESEASQAAVAGCQSVIQKEIDRQ